MKRTLVALMLVVALIAPAFGQTVGSTWFNPLDTMTVLPSSIPNYVSNGIFADEIDFIFRSPINLADYSGYSIYTAYGNYGSMVGDTTWTNPFSTTTLTNLAEIGTYQVAAAFPIFGKRAAFMLGHTYSERGNILGGLGFRSADESSTTTVVDANTLGIADSTTTSTYASTAKTTSSRTTGLAGVSLGNIGVSLLAFQNTTARTIGGSRSDSWTIGTDPVYVLALPGSSVTTAQTLYVGYGELGAATNYGSTGTIGAQAVGQYKLGMFPIIATLGFSSINSGLGLGAVKTAYSQSVAYASTAGATAVATDVNTYAMTYGTNKTAAWTMGAALPVWAAVPAAAYIDPTASKNSVFAFNVAGGVEPIFALNDTLSFRTKGLLGIESSTDSAVSASVAASTASIATTAAENDTWAYGYNSSSSTIEGVFSLNLELGGMAELKDPTGFITLGAGAFFEPTFDFGSTTKATAVTTTTRAYTDSVNANPILGTTTTGQAPATAAANIAIGGFEGSSTLTSTTTYSGNDTSTAIGLDINLPVAVKFSVAEGKFAAIFGYTMVHSSVVTTVKLADSRTVVTATVSDGTATVYDSTNATNYPAGADLDDTTTTSGTTTVTTSSAWNGQMGWCLRWMPKPALTIDLKGSTVLTALNGVGFNDFRLDDILSNLGISATFRF